MDLAKGIIHPAFITQLAGAYGESEEGLTKAIHAATPTLLAGFLHQSETADGSNTLHKLATEAAGGGLLHSSGALVNTDATTPVAIHIMTVLNRSFGEKWGIMTTMIAQYAGIKLTASKGLLSLLAPALLAIIGKKVKEENLSAAGLTSWLLGQKESIVAASPSGYPLAEAIGLSSVGSLGLGAANMSSGVKVPSDSATVSAPKNSGKKWLLPLLVLVAIGILLWYFSRNEKTTDSPPAVDTTLVSEVPAPAVILLF